MVQIHHCSQYCLVQRCTWYRIMSRNIVCYAPLSYCCLHSDCAGYGEVQAGSELYLHDPLAWSLVSLPEMENLVWWYIGQCSAQLYLAHPRGSWLYCGGVHPITHIPLSLLTQMLQLPDNTNTAVILTNIVTVGDLLGDQHRLQWGCHS